MVRNLQQIYVNKVCSTMYPHAVYFVLQVTTAVKSLEIRLVQVLLACTVFSDYDYGL